MPFHGQGCPMTGRGTERNNGQIQRMFCSKGHSFDVWQTNKYHTNKKAKGFVMTRPAIVVFTSGGVIFLRIDKRIVALFLQELVELRILLVQIL